MGTPNSPPRDRILFVQWVGDYREAFNRIQSGGPENYYAQWYSMVEVANLVSRSEQTGVLCCCGDDPHDEVLSNGVRSINAGASTSAKDLSPILRQIETFGPTHLIAATPTVAILRWGLAHGVDTLGLFADSFMRSRQDGSAVREMVRSLRHKLRNRTLARLLNDRRIRCVANHHIGASRDLVRIGVDPAKIVPWHYPPTNLPDAFPVKSGPGPGAPWQLCFVGSIIESKGIRDAIGAVAVLRGRGRDVRLTVIGGGEIDRFAGLARERGISESVTFEGRQGNDRVVAAMAASHAVLVLSHHNYPEGMPLVIQEALASRSPMICSDHPVFRERVSPEAVQIVPQRDPGAVADAVEGILGDPARYHAMSVATRANFEELQAPPRWHEVFNHWLGRTPEDDRWLAEHTLASGRYDPRRDARSGGHRPN